MRVFELQQIMPPPPLLILHALLPLSETGNFYPFQGWSLQQLDGLGSELDHVERACAGLQQQVQEELDKMEQLEEDGMQDGCECWVEGVGGHSTPKPDRHATAAFDESSEQHGGRREAASAELGDSLGQEEDEGEGDFQYEEDEEEEYDYQGQKDGGLGTSNKRVNRNSFWGWMNQ